MFYLKRALEKYGEIKVSIVGCGIMGTSLLTQLNLLDNFKPQVLSSRRIESVLRAFEKAEIDRSKIKITNDIDEAKAYLKEGYYIATTNSDIAAKCSECVVDCTGDTEEGVKISLSAIEAGVDIVTLNVEMDATVGPYLKHLADEKGVLYTGSSGDEPGAIIELYEFLISLGFEVLVLGKGKNNKLNNYVTREELEEEAKLKGINPKMLTSFVDGTNTMTELNAVCNATGFVPDIRGCHCFNTSRDNISKDIDLKENGSKLNSYGIVDFAMGVAPGVFAIAKAKSEIISDEMRYLSMGEGPNFSIYRPYHLTSIETPNSIIRAVVLRDSSIVSIGEPVADTITIAKRDIKAGEKIVGIGGNDVFGQLERIEVSRKEDLVPIGLIVGKVTSKVDIKKGTAIKYSDLNLDKDSLIVNLRRKQDNFFIDLRENSL
ncbi:MAG: NAD(P)H-dependent oxidoreductase [Peptoniphilaceae bacterium]